MNLETLVLTQQTVAVGLGEYKISREAGEVLVAYGLGSCVGIGVYDAQLRVGGLLHAILPEHHAAAAPLDARYVDSGLAAMLDDLLCLGAKTARLTVCLAGGAKMLDVFDSYRSLSIGARNLAVAQALLTARQIKIKAQAVGGRVGRTLRVYVADGRMTVRTLHQPERDF